METLKKIIIEKIGRTLESPADFNFLSEQIRHATGEYLSPTTLKRLFGYIPQEGQPRRATLSILARYAGYGGWQDYLDKQHVESGFISAKRIMATELPKGQKILLAWNPNRECVVEYMGDECFVVVQAINCKLKVGDRFSASQFIVGQPLTATNVILLRSEENKMDVYVAGAQTGISKIELLHV